MSTARLTCLAVVGLALTVTACGEPAAEQPNTAVTTDALMPEDEFWALIEAVNEEAGQDLLRKEKVLGQQLDRLSIPKLRQYWHRWDEVDDRAYDWHLWAAAWVLQGGCSDDGFSDFRSTVILLGRAVYEAALRNPDSLIEVVPIVGGPGSLYFENFGYVHIRVWEKKVGETWPARLREFPTKPSGPYWADGDTAALERLVPRIWAKYGGDQKD